MLKTLAEFSIPQLDYRPVGRRVNRLFSGGPGPSAHIGSGAGCSILIPRAGPPSTPSKYHTPDRADTPGVVRTVVRARAAERCADRPRKKSRQLSTAPSMKSINSCSFMAPSIPTIRSFPSFSRSKFNSVTPRADSWHPVRMWAAQVSSHHGCSWTRQGFSRQRARLDQSSRH